MASAGDAPAKAANGRPLSYTPYQSHRRTASQRSNQSVSNQQGSSHDSILSYSPQVSSPLNPQPTSSVPPQSMKPSQVLSTLSAAPKARPGELPAPPPLRRWQPAASISPSGTNPVPQEAAGPSHVVAPARTRPPSIPSVKEDTGDAKLSSRKREPTATAAVEPLKRVSSPDANHNGSYSTSNGRSSPAVSTSSVEASSSRSDLAAARTQSSLMSPRQRDFVLPAAKQMSTSQALRMRDYRQSGTSTPSDVSERTLPGAVAPHTGPNHSELDKAFRMASAAGSYGSTFQPRGVSRSRMPDLVELRRASKGKAKAARVASLTGSRTSQEEVERAEERLRRRVEKLVSIHYPTSNGRPILQSQGEQATVSSTLLSSLAPRSRFFATLKETSTTRAMEQALVPWQPDDAVTACPLCSKPFGGLAGRRKHHCRACGRVVCASPEVTANSAGSDMGMAVDARGAAPLFAKCSGIVVRDGESSLHSSSHGSTVIVKDQDVGAGLEAILNTGARTASNLQSTSASTVPQGFRICRDCREVVMRGQYMDEEGSAPLYVQLYSDLCLLQREIESSLPEFQELVLGLQQSDAGSTLGTVDKISSPTGAARTKSDLLKLQRDAASARKQLLANFANYDALAKRIRDLPDGGDTSLQRLKEAVWIKAGVFLQTNMFPLQSLPKFDSKPAKHRRQTSSAPSTAAGSANGSVESNEQLAILQEQKSQIAGFLERANKERKLNDAAVLKRNLEELEAEIMRLTRPQ
ncbi:unnamed protein product [Parajaminaea phylloscopi]